MAELNSCNGCLKREETIKVLKNKISQKNRLITLCKEFSNCVDIKKLKFSSDEVNNIFKTIANDSEVLRNRLELFISENGELMKEKEDFRQYISQLEKKSSFAEDKLKHLAFFNKQLVDHHTSSTQELSELKSRNRRLAKALLKHEPKNAEAKRSLGVTPMKKSRDSLLLGNEEDNKFLISGQTDSSEGLHYNSHQTQSIDSVEPLSCSSFDSDTICDTDEDFNDVPVDENIRLQKRSVKKEKYQKPSNTLLQEDQTEIMSEFVQSKNRLTPSPIKDACSISELKDKVVSKTVPAGCDNTFSIFDDLAPNATSFHGNSAFEDTSLNSNNSVDELTENAISNNHSQAFNSSDVCTPLGHPSNNDDADMESVDSSQKISVKELSSVNLERCQQKLNNFNCDNNFDDFMNSNDCQSVTKSQIFENKDNSKKNASSNIKNKINKLEFELTDLNKCPVLLSPIKSIKSTSSENKEDMILEKHLEEKNDIVDSSSICLDKCENIPVDPHGRSHDSFSNTSPTTNINTKQGTLSSKTFSSKTLITPDLDNIIDENPSFGSGDICFDRPGEISEKLCQPRVYDSFTNSSLLDVSNAKHETYSSTQQNGKTPITSDTNVRQKVEKSERTSPSLTNNTYRPQQDFSDGRNSNEGNLHHERVEFMWNFENGTSAQFSVPILKGRDMMEIALNQDLKITNRQTYSTKHSLFINWDPRRNTRNSFIINLNPTKIQPDSFLFNLKPKSTQQSAVINLDSSTETSDRNCNSPYSSEIGSANDYRSQEKGTQLHDNIELFKKQELWRKKQEEKENCDNGNLTSNVPFNNNSGGFLTSTVFPQMLNPDDVDAMRLSLESAALPSSPAGRTRENDTAFCSSNGSHSSFSLKNKPAVYNPDNKQNSKNCPRVFGQSFREGDKHPFLSSGNSKNRPGSPPPNKVVTTLPKTCSASKNIIPKFNDEKDKLMDPIKIEHLQNHDIMEQPIYKRESEASSTDKGTFYEELSTAHAKSCLNKFTDERHESSKVKISPPLLNLFGPSNSTYQIKSCDESLEKNNITYKDSIENSTGKYPNDSGEIKSIIDKRNFDNSGSKNVSIHSKSLSENGLPSISESSPGRKKKRLRNHRKQPPVPLYPEKNKFKNKTSEKWEIQDSQCTKSIEQSEKLVPHLLVEDSDLPITKDSRGDLMNACAHLEEPPITDNSSTINKNETDIKCAVDDFELPLPKKKRNSNDSTQLPTELSISEKCSANIINSSAIQESPRGLANDHCGTPQLQKEQSTKNPQNSTSILMHASDDSELAKKELFHSKTQKIILEKNSSLKENNMATEDLNKTLSVASIKDATKEATMRKVDIAVTDPELYVFSPVKKRLAHVPKGKPSKPICISNNGADNTPEKTNSSRVNDKNCPAKKSVLKGTFTKNNLEQNVNSSKEVSNGAGFKIPKEKKLRDTRAQQEDSNEIDILDHIFRTHHCIEPLSPLSLSPGEYVNIEEPEDVNNSIESYNVSAVQPSTDIGRNIKNMQYESKAIAVGESSENINSSSKNIEADKKKTMNYQNLFKSNDTKNLNPFETSYDNSPKKDLLKKCIEGYSILCKKIDVDRNQYNLEPNSVNTYTNSNTECQEENAKSYEVGVINKNDFVSNCLSNEKSVSLISKKTKSIQSNGSPIMKSVRNKKICLKTLKKIKNKCPNKATELLTSDIILPTSGDAEKDTIINTKYDKLAVKGSTKDEHNKYSLEDKIKPFTTEKKDKWIRYEENDPILLHNNATNLETDKFIVPSDIDLVTECNSETSLTDTDTNSALISAFNKGDDTYQVSCITNKNLKNIKAYQNRRKTTSIKRNKLLYKPTHTNLNNVDLEYTDKLKPINDLSNILDGNSSPKTSINENESDNITLNLEIKDPFTETRSLFSLSYLYSELLESPLEEHNKSLANEDKELEPRVSELRDPLIPNFQFPIDNPNKITTHLKKSFIKSTHNIQTENDEDHDKKKNFCEQSVETTNGTEKCFTLPLLKSDNSLKNEIGKIGSSRVSELREPLISDFKSPINNTNENTTPFKDFYIDSTHGTHTEKKDQEINETVCEDNIEKSNGTENHSNSPLLKSNDNSVTEKVNEFGPKISKLRKSMISVFKSPINNTNRITTPFKQLYIQSTHGTHTEKKDQEKSETVCADNIETSNGTKNHCDLLLTSNENSVTEKVNEFGPRTSKLRKAVISDFKSPINNTNRITSSLKGFYLESTHSTRIERKDPEKTETVCEENIEPSNGTENHRDSLLLKSNDSSVTEKVSEFEPITSELRKTVISDLKSSINNTNRITTPFKGFYIESTHGTHIEKEDQKKCETVCEDNLETSNGTENHSDSLLLKSNDNSVTEKVNEFEPRISELRKPVISDFKSPINRMNRITSPLKGFYIESTHTTENKDQEKIETVCEENIETSNCSEKHSDSPNLNDQGSSDFSVEECTSFINENNCKKRKNIKSLEKSEVPPKKVKTGENVTINNEPGSTIECPENLFVSACKFYLNKVLLNGWEKDKKPVINKKCISDIKFEIKKVIGASGNNLYPHLNKVVEPLIGSSIMQPRPLAKAIIELLCEDKGKEPEENPKLTTTTKVCLLFSISCIGYNHEFLIEILKVFEEQLCAYYDKSLTVPVGVKLITFYGALCRSYNLNHKGKQMLYDILYARHIKAYPMVYRLLSTWPLILPKSDKSLDEDCLLTKTIVLILLSTSKVPPSDKNKLLYEINGLQSFLRKYYGYNYVLRRDDICDELVKRIPEKGCRLGLILLAHCEGYEWGLSLVEKKLFPIVQGWLQHKLDHITGQKVILTIGMIVRAFPLTRSAYIVKTTLDLFEKVLHQSPDIIFSETVIEAVSLLRRHNLFLCVGILCRWTPKNNVVTNKTLDHVRNILCVKDISYWRSFYFKHCS